jgi:hypothetical protein
VRHLDIGDLANERQKKIGARRRCRSFVEALARHTAATKYYEQNSLESVRHVKVSINPAVKTRNHVLRHPSEQVRQNNHRMV